MYSFKRKNLQKTTRCSKHNKMLYRIHITIWKKLLFFQYNEVQKSLYRIQIAIFIITMMNSFIYEVVLILCIVGMYIRMS